MPLVIHCVVEGARADFDAPPLAGHDVGQQANARICRRRASWGSLPAPAPKRRASWSSRHLDHIETVGLRRAKGIGKKPYSRRRSAPGRWQIVGGGSLSGRPSRCWVRPKPAPLYRPAITVPGRPGLVQLKVVLVAGLAAGQSDRFGPALTAVWPKTFTPCGTRMCISAVKRWSENRPARLLLETSAPGRADRKIGSEWQPA